MASKTGSPLVDTGLGGQGVSIEGPAGQRAEHPQIHRAEEGLGCPKGGSELLDALGR